MKTRCGRISAVVLVVALAGCSSTAGSTETSVSDSPPATPASTSPSEFGQGFPDRGVRRLDDKPVPDALAAELQEVLEKSAKGDGLTATVISRRELEWRDGLRRRASSDGPERSDVHRPHHADTGGGPGDAAGRGGRAKPRRSRRRSSSALSGVRHQRREHRRSPRSPQRAPRYGSAPGSGRASRPTRCTPGRPKRSSRPSDLNVGRSGRSWEFIGTNYICSADRRTRHRSAARRGAAERRPRRRRVRAPHLSARRAADRTDGDAVRCSGRHLRGERRISPLDRPRRPPRTPRPTWRRTHRASPDGSGHCAPVRSSRLRRSTR